jgi:hypothetical protein
MLTGLLIFGPFTAVAIAASVWEQFQLSERLNTPTRILRRRYSPPLRPWRG